MTGQAWAAPLRRLASGALALVAASCGEPAPDLAGRPHVVIVSIDTLRAGNLGCYGHERATSPHIDDIARRGVRFAEAHSQATSTLASHLSLFSSLYPPQFGIVRDDGKNWVQNVTRLQLSPEVVTLAETLRDAGYETAAFSGGGLVSRSYGVDAGFETFWQAMAPDESTLEVSLPKLTGWLDEWLARRDEDGRAFVFLHTYDVHDPYRAPAPFKRAFTERRAEQFAREEGYTTSTEEFKKHLPSPTPEQLEEIEGFYDNGIAYADDCVGRLESALRERGLWDDTLLVVLSDHGEEFMEHGSWGHGPTIFRELTHVPLVVRFPGDAHAGTVVEQPVALVDVAPSVLDWVGLPVPDDWMGESLAPLVEGVPREGERMIYSEIANERIGIRGVRKGRWLLVWDRKNARRELFDVQADPGELHDVAAEHPDVAAELGNELETWLVGLLRTSGALQAVPMDEGTLNLVEYEQDVLRQLGYVK